ncbi:hypothetical protein D3C77_635060 [compost metagenome]
MRPWGGVICKETMGVAPFPDSGCDDESSSPPPHATSNKAAMDAHIHLNICFIVCPNKLFILCSWPSLSGRLRDRGRRQTPIPTQQMPVRRTGMRQIVIASPERRDHAITGGN